MCAVLWVAAPASAQGSSESGAGRLLFVTYCASCHGIDARGGGPVAVALTAAPPDLTRLADRYGIPLPTGMLAEFIDGRRDVEAHGSREMPVWGEVFYEDEVPGAPDPEAAKRRTIELLVEYLVSIQRLLGAAR